MVELLPFSLIVLYLLPFLVAALRNHDMLGTILVANILLGWTILGWILILFVAGAAPVDRIRAARRS